MPVTFAPAARTDAQDAHPTTSRDVAPVTAASLLSAANVDARARIVRSSIGGLPGPDNTHFKIAPTPGNGFVDTVLCAYTQHHALVIRPDHVWLAIVSQFSFYATAEANARSFLTDASGKIAGLALEVSVESDAAQPDVTRLSRRITRLLQKTVPDADLRKWLVPEFSTTTLSDVAVSCLLVLSGSCSSSATQTRSGGDADHTFPASCGIPRVTLEGERADWELLLTRLDLLKTRCKDFGLPAVAWYHLLHPVLTHFVGAFDDPQGVENREFWGGIVVGKEESNESEGGSQNAGKLSGWITTFCAFSVEGTWLGPELIVSAAADAPETLTAAQFWSTYTRLAPAPEKPKQKPKLKPAKGKAKKKVQLFVEAESAEPPAPTIVIAFADVPPAYASTELSLSLKTKNKVSGGVNGTVTIRKHAYTVLAGLVGTGFSSSRDTELSATGRNDTVRSVVAWWIYERGGAGADANGNRKAEVQQDAKNTTDKKEDSEERIPVVPAPCVRFDLGLNIDRELDVALAETAGAGIGVGLQDTTSPGAGAGATDPHEPEPEPVSASALAPALQIDPWSLDLDTPVVPAPPAQPAAPTSSFDDPHPDVAGSGGDGGWDADANTGGWGTALQSTPASVSEFRFESGSGTAAAAVSDPKTEPELEALVSSDGQDAPASALAPAESQSLGDVAPTAGTGDGGETEVKPGEEQTQEQLETQAEPLAPDPPAPEDPEPQPEPDAPTAGTGDGGENEVKPGEEQEQQLETQTEPPVPAPPAPEDPEPQPDPDAPTAGTGAGGETEVKPGEKQMQEQEQQSEEPPAPAPPAPEDPEPEAEADATAAVVTPAAQAGDGDGEGEGEDAADEAPTPAQATTAKGGGKSNAGGAKGGKAKKKKGKK